jgi:hypothetical protein
MHPTRHFWLWAARTLLCILMIVLCLRAAPASAALLSLIDNNSSADFDTATPSNNYNWFVDGTDLLAQQAFWYRIGAAGPESSVHTLPIGVQGTSDTNFDGNPDTLFVRHNGAGFRVETTYTLRGGAPGSRSADMGELISIFNLGQSNLEFHFFQYADFDLSAADTVLFTNANTVDQSGGAIRLSETIVTPVPSHREAAFFPVTLNKLNDALPTTLIDNAGIGAGDVTWAFQWDVIIPPSSTFQISKDKSIRIIPEPASAALLIAGFTIMGMRKSRTVVKGRD